MDVSKLRVPLGSLMVDVALVISVFYAAGQLTERLESIDMRVARIESVKITAEADRRISVLEGQSIATVARLERIEDKLDRLLERRR